MIEEIKFGGYKLFVKEVENLLLESKALGEYAPIRQEILIDENLTKQQKQEVLIHEILEAIGSIYKLDMLHDDLNIIGIALHQIFKDNKKLVKFLSEN
jgi:hypothetical protein